MHNLYLGDLFGMFALGIITRYYKTDPTSLKIRFKCSFLTVSKKYHTLEPISEGKFIKIHSNEYSVEITGYHISVQVSFEL